jgi:hypothetical protein
MDKKQTAVQWLYDELAQCLHREEVCDLVYKLEQQAKEMEREQIVDAFGIGCQVESTRLIGYHDMANQHYNETYGGQDER